MEAQCCIYTNEWTDNTGQCVSKSHSRTGTVGWQTPPPPPTQTLSHNQIPSRQLGVPWLQGEDSRRFRGRALGKSPCQHGGQWRWWDQATCCSVRFCAGNDRTPVNDSAEENCGCKSSGLAMRRDCNQQRFAILGHGVGRQMIYLITAALFMGTRTLVSSVLGSCHGKRYVGDGV